jgi:hypothetical protein
MYQVIMLLPGGQGVQQVTLTADHLLTDPATLGATLAALPPGESCLLLKPGDALALSVSHLAATETGAESEDEHGAVDYDRLAAALAQQPVTVQIDTEQMKHLARTENRYVRSANLADGVGGL